MPLDWWPYGCVSQGQSKCVKSLQCFNCTLCNGLIIKLTFQKLIPDAKPIPAEELQLSVEEEEGQLDDDDDEEDEVVLMVVKEEEKEIEQERQRDEKKKEKEKEIEDKRRRQERFEKSKSEHIQAEQAKGTLFMVFIGILKLKKSMDV